VAAQKAIRAPFSRQVGVTAYRGDLPVQNLSFAKHRAKRTVRGDFSAFLTWRGAIQSANNFFQIRYLPRPGDWAYSRIIPRKREVDVIRRKPRRGLKLRQIWQQACR
jgi:hypothetical protein